MNPIIEHGAMIAALMLAFVAAVTDAKTGRIPNAVTIPVLLLAPLGHALWGGAFSLATSLFGALLCLLVPFLMHHQSQGRAMGGGDVKLFAALGALLGPSLGLETEFASCVTLCVLALTQLALRGRLLRFMVGLGWLLLSPLLPRTKRRTIEPDGLTQMRMGPAVFVGLCLVVALNGFETSKWPM